MTSNHKLKMYIPSLGREGKQLTLNWIPDNWKDRVFLVCPKEEVHDWPNRVDVPLECQGNIGKTRQWIIDQSDSRYVGQLDDDLTFYKRHPTELTKRAKIESLGEMLDLMESWLLSGEVYCGISNTFMSQNKPDEYYYGKPSASLFVDKEYLAEKNIRYDDMNYFEDFDVPLRVLESGKRLKYTGRFMSKERKANAEGGCSTTRTANGNREAMLRLKERHSDYIKLVEDDEATNQSLKVGYKMTIYFKKCYEDNVKGKDNAIFDI